MSKDHENKNDSKNHLSNQTEVLTLDLPAVVDGEIVPIEEVEDSIFSNKIIGDGYAIHPSGKTIYSPIDAEVEQVASTNHAVYLSVPGGIKLLIHIGIDTIELKGQGFKSQLAKGTRIEKGAPLVEIDREYIINEGYNPIVSVVLLDQQNKKHKVTVYPTKEAIANETKAAQITFEK